MLSLERPNQALQSPGNARDLMLAIRPKNGQRSRCDGSEKTRRNFFLDLHI
jgi:hypothetical protein